MSKMSVVKKQSSPEYAYYDKMAELKRKMPISWVYLLGSCILWIFLTWAMYKGVAYGLIYMRLDDSDMQGFCQEDFSEDLTENFDRLQDVPKGDAWTILPALGLSAKKRPKQNSPEAHADLKETTKDTFPPVVTAVTSDDFLAVQGLAHQIKTQVRPMYKDKADIKFIVYQLSLTGSEVSVLSRHCDCLVRSIDETKFPAHVLDWSISSWKAVVIQLALKEFGSALWVDPSSRLYPDYLYRAVALAEERGYVLWPEEPQSTAVAMTNPEMFKFYKEYRCTFKESLVIDSSAMLFYGKDLTLRGIMTPWLKCVLTKSCVAPAHSRRDDCLTSRLPLYTGCHKYDQSALSIVVNRLLLFSENTEKLVPTFRLAKRVSLLEEHFLERPWTRKHRDYAVYAVIAFIFCMIFVSIFGTFFLECLGIRFRMKRNSSNV